MKNRRSVYFHKPFKEKATFTKYPSVCVSMFTLYRILAVLITILIDINQNMPMASHSALVKCPKGKLYVWHRRHGAGGCSILHS